VLGNCKGRYRFHVSDEQRIEETTQLLAAGRIVGWFHGAAEFGPRALGNRKFFPRQELIGDSRFCRRPTCTPVSRCPAGLRRESLSPQSNLERRADPYLSWQIQWLSHSQLCGFVDHACSTDRSTFAKTAQARVPVLP